MITYSFNMAIQEYEFEQARERAEKQLLGPGSLLAAYTPLLVTVIRNPVRFVLDVCSVFLVDFS
jgi:hypothetical protein